MVKFEEIIKRFQIEGEITEVKPLGHGTVNHTYEIVCGGEHYVLQEMNHFVFKYPTEVMNNLFLVTEYLREVIEREGRDPDMETLHYIRTDAGNQLLQTERGSYYRLYRMIYCAEEMEKPTRGDQAYDAGRILGEFHRRMREFDVNQLSRTFPNMHNMKILTSRLLDAVRADICFRTSDCQEQIQFVLDRSKDLNRLRDALKSGEIPLRVAHNDARYSNILLNKESKKALCLIDLDTIMPGTALFDFGEAVRTGAATVGENETAGDVELDLDLFKGYLQGYFSEMGRVLTDKEKELLGYSVWMMTMRSGMHYLIDYLSGDRMNYDFSDERQNLFRAVNQFFLALDIEDKKDAIEEIIQAAITRH